MLWHAGAREGMTGETLGHKPGGRLVAGVMERVRLRETLCQTGPLEINRNYEQAQGFGARVNDSQTCWQEGWRDPPEESGTVRLRELLSAAGWPPRICF